ncbi:MAG: aspartate aminotransferase family protein [Planctomycetota bacterium]
MKRKPPELPAVAHQPKRYTGISAAEALELRRRYLTPGLITYYQQPLMIVEGHRQYVYDEQGRRYLDGFAGIATVSVGHCHPKIVEVASRQLATLQHSTTIYLHPTVGEYGQRLAAKLPGELNVCYFVNSGSEANDLAMLMSRLYTGSYDMLALRNGYHGGVASAMALTANSKWKFGVAHSFGVHHALCPDVYRGAWRADEPHAAAKYANDLQDLIDTATSGRVAGFIAESIQGVGGVVVYPDGYLARAFEIVRAAGGLAISDEVQTGFGRTGENFWGFMAQGVVPDIVTMAKGIGNGAPLAAVVTRREIAETLARRIHFNTYAGNPVSSAIGKTVIEIIEEERLQENAHDVGGYLLARLRELKEEHTLIGDVRGRGLMIGVELVRDRQTREPANTEAAQVLERARTLGLLLGKGGLAGNVIRIKPPLCITRADADFLVAAFGCALARD